MIGGKSLEVAAANQARGILQHPESGLEAGLLKSFRSQVCPLCVDHYSQGYRVSAINHPRTPLFMDSSA